MRTVLALDAARRGREDSYERFVRALNRRRDGLVAEVAARLGALSGGQQAAARWILAAVGGVPGEEAAPGYLKGWASTAGGVAR